jgi:hypothetical protein
VAEQSEGDRSIGESEYYEELGESFDVPPEVAERYVAEADQTMRSSGISPPDPEDYRPERSSFYSESATVCGSSAAVGLFPVIDGRPAALDQHERVKLADAGELPSMVTAAWVANDVEGTPVYIWTTVVAPEVAIVAATDAACSMQEAFEQIEVEWG